MSILDEIKSSISTERTLIYQNRVNFLKERLGNISHLTKGVDDVMKNLEKGEDSFVIYGEPQSGKTELMLALTCRLLDQGYENIFVVMNDNVSLENQNFNRFAECRQLDPAPIQSQEIIQDDSIILPNERHVIFCRKNAKNLEKIITSTRKLKKRVIIDDEADFASVDNKINKPDDASKINTLMSQLIKAGNTEEENSVYIGVTATPGRLDLNNTFFNNSKEWVFIDPYPGYTGRQTFFPASRNDPRELSYNLKKIPDNDDSPKYLTDAVLRFILRNTYLNLSKPSDERQPYTMLIHTSGAVADHEKDRKDVQKVLNRLKKDDEKLYEKLSTIALDIFTKEQLNLISTKEILAFIYQNKGKTKVLEINSQKDNQGNDTKAANPTAQFTFALGGNIISRGLTFNNLLSFFFTRNVKNKLQQNTYIQRARMFGNRKNLEFFELVVPESLWGNWIDCFMLHELALASAKAGNPVWFSNKKVNASDSAAIDNANIDIDKGEITVGSIFKLNDVITKIILDPKLEALSKVEKLLSENLIDESVFPKVYLDIFKNIPELERSFMMVTPNERGGEDRIRNIETLTSGGVDYKNLTRERGGLIDLTINKRPQYEHARQLIMPIQNAEGYCRFYYKSNMEMSMLRTR